jgi:hypothetical protein
MFRSIWHWLNWKRKGRFNYSQLLKKSLPNSVLLKCSFFEKERRSFVFGYFQMQLLWLENLSQGTAKKLEKLTCQCSFLSRNSLILSHGVWPFRPMLDSRCLNFVFVPEVSFGFYQLHGLNNINSKSLRQIEE